MRILLNQSSQVALSRIQTRCNAINPAIESCTGPFLMQFLIAIESILTADEWNTLAEKLTSERIKKKRIVERLMKLGEKLDESDIDKFEKKLERKTSISNSDSQQKPGEIS